MRCFQHRTVTIGRVDGPEDIWLLQAITNSYRYLQNFLLKETTHTLDGIQTQAWQTPTDNKSATEPQSWYLVKFWLCFLLFVNMLNLPYVSSIFVYNSDSLIIKNPCTDPWYTHTLLQVHTCILSFSLLPIGSTCWLRFCYEYYCYGCFWICNVSFLLFKHTLENLSAMAIATLNFFTIFCHPYLYICVIL